MQLVDRALTRTIFHEAVINPDLSKLLQDFHNRFCGSFHYIS